MEKDKEGKKIRRGKVRRGQGWTEEKNNNRQENRKKR
jgi:hypothetical protein